MTARRSFATRSALLAQGAGAALLFAILRLMPVAWASGIAGFLAGHIGPRLGISRRARRNLRHALPELDAAAIERVIAGMWDNLGRVAAEYAHLDKYRAYEEGGRIEVVGGERLRAIAATGKPAIFFSGHFGNWEMASLALTQAGLPVTAIYRAANNPFVDRLINRIRRPLGTSLVPKGAAGARDVVAALRQGCHLATLVDQKANDGIAVPFFGRDAMTPAAPARLALRFDCVLVPVRVERLPHARFRITIETPFPPERSGDRVRDTLATMCRINAILERWIRAQPDHWFWLHNRWPD